MLTTEEIRILESLTEPEQVFVKAKFSKLIREHTNLDLENGCADIVADVISAAGPGSKNDKEVAINIYMTLSQDLRKPKFLKVALAEVSEACYRGVRREFGDFFAPNISVIHGWIDAYMRLKDRTEAINKFTLKLKDQPVSTTEVPVFIQVKRDKEAAINCFTDYKTSGKLPFFGFAYYDCLVKLLGVKTLVSDPEVRASIKRQTVDGYKDKLVAEKERAERRGSFNEANAIMERILTGVSADATVLNKQKELALKWYFDSLINQNKDLEL